MSPIAVLVGSQSCCKLVLRPCCHISLNKTYTASTPEKPHPVRAKQAASRPQRHTTRVYCLQQEALDVSLRQSQLLQHEKSISAPCGLLGRLIWPSSGRAPGWAPRHTWARSRGGAGSPRRPHWGAPATRRPPHHCRCGSTAAALWQSCCATREHGHGLRSTCDGSTNIPVLTGVANPQVPRSHLRMHNA